MNIRLQYDFDFLAGIHYDDRLQLNSYSVSLSMLTQTLDPTETNIAMDRLKYFVNGQMESTVFVNQANMPRAEMLTLLGANVTTLPEEPVDQIIGMMLYYKLNAIMEGRIEITQLDISSTLGDGVWYLHDAEDNAGPFVQKGWWHEPTTQHDTVEMEPASEKVVKVISTGWYEAGLDWPEEPPPAANTVVFANFAKNED